MALRARAARALNASAEPSFGWLDELAPADVDFLRALPFTLSLPARGALVVHAG